MTSTSNYNELRREYDEIQVGETATMSKTITATDVHAFAALIDDNNPVHLDPEYAKTTMFGGPIAHGMHTASFFTTLIATRLPGILGVYVSQELNFLRPVRLGDTIEAQAEVTAKNDARRRITLATTVRNQHGELVVDGQAVIAVMKKT